MTAVLMFGATETDADLFHLIPTVIGDPFPYLEDGHGRRAAVIWPADAVVATGAPADEAAAIFEEMIPLRRHARPEEIARAVVFLAGDDSGFMTGATLALDGRMSI